MSLPLPEGALAFRESCDKRIIQLVEELTHEGRLRDAMKHALLAGGKRVRPLLAFGAAEAVGKPGETLMHVACALEMMHTYSLVHDDLPSMDDDQLRRGQPTTHVAFDEATAILAGDALQAMAFQVIAEAPGPAANLLRCQRYLADAVGAKGMVGGQIQDIQMVGSQPAQPELQQMHSRKTGALIRASVLMGACCSTHPTISQLGSLDQYASALGIAFQIRDDMLDSLSSTEVLGKTSGSDIAHDKPNYVAILGMEGAEEALQQQYQQAIAGLECFAGKAATLEALATFIVQRMH